VPEVALIVILLKGVAVGVVVALPFGPVGLLFVRRTLFEGVSFGLASGLGAACADTIFGVIAGLGLSVVRDWILSYQDWLGTAGGLYLVYAGLRALAARHVPEPEPLAGEALAGAFASAFALTITNPITILAFAAIFTKVGVGNASSHVAIAMLVAGVFVGSTLWWIAISIGIAPFRHRRHSATLRWINLVSGAILLLSGAGLLTIAGLGLAGVRV
jgi:threonine/homoserine/homoserine lactone efflux protein